MEMLDRTTDSGETLTGVGELGKQETRKERKFIRKIRTIEIGYFEA